ncbi:MAG: PPOX class F420-dependent oxidoreductase [Dehalococcoidia bacterium]
MAIRLPEDVRNLFEARNWAYLATLMPDGSPQVTPVWVDVEGEHILVNTTEGFRKERNMRRDPRVTITVASAENPETYAQVRGSVVEVGYRGAEGHIDKLAKKYLGKDCHPWREPEACRVILRIQPEKIYVQIYDPERDHHDIRSI